jgi:hypothetical protein
MRAARAGGIGKDRKAFRRCCGSVDGDIDGYLALRAEKTTKKVPALFLKTL